MALEGLIFLWLKELVSVFVRTFYYLIECYNISLLEEEDVFYITEGSNEFEFRWVDIEDMK